jgi:hypothetical protein
VKPPTDFGPIIAAVAIAILALLIGMKVGIDARPPALYQRAIP